MDYERIKHLASAGDISAQFALITEARRRGEDQLAVATIGSLDLTAEYPPHGFPAYLQGLPSDLACVLWQLEACPAMYRIEGNPIRACDVRRHLTPNGGTRAGGWTLSIWFEVFPARHQFRNLQSGGWTIKAKFRAYNHRLAPDTLLWNKHCWRTVLNADALLNLRRCIRNHYQSHVYQKTLDFAPHLQRV